MGGAVLNQTVGSRRKRGQKIHFVYSCKSRRKCGFTTLLCRNLPLWLSGRRRLIHTIRKRGNAMLQRDPSRQNPAAAGCGWRRGPGKRHIRQPIGNNGTQSQGLKRQRGNCASSLTRRLFGCDWQTVGNGGTQSQRLKRGTPRHARSAATGKPSETVGRKARG